MRLSARIRLDSFLDEEGIKAKGKKGTFTRYVDFFLI
jgi:hypothetical protein